MNDDNTSWLLLAGAIVVAGKWANKEGMDVPAVVALTIIAVMMAVLQEIDAKVAKYLTILVLIVVLLKYGTVILSKLQNHPPIEKLSAK